ncbi:DUF6387 family protein [Serratia marcescens]|uniref:DUF6387 family protein n=1 Tax=Serratia marcescens TaxID=615 RepID=UPI003ED9E4B3
MLIRHKSDLPEFFDLEKYKEFESLDDREFYNQLLARHYMVADYEQWLEENDIKEIISNPVVDRKYSDDAFSGMDITSFNETENDGNSSKRLDRALLVEPLQRHHIFKITNSDKVFGENECSSFELLDSVNLLDDFGNDFFLKLDLRYPDEFIVDDLLPLLSSWRKSLNIPDPNNELTVNSWSVVRAKIQRYRIFPLADLLTWQKITGNTIKNSVLTVALYPNGEYSETQLSQTVKVFLEKNLSNFSLEKFEREIRERIIEQKNRRKK